MPSIYGFVLSLCTVVVMMAYATYKFDFLLNRKNPNITQVDKPGVIEESTRFNFRDAGL